MASTALRNIAADPPLADAECRHRQHMRAVFWRLALAGLGVFWTGALALAISRLV
ncbi:hypothetical protein [Alteraurantiacibacter palmitatis]|uniref:DUF2474 domain-containing protein n=1 Tax=Alteraurantiacibacter palmitatis TaxID=2054628 RepID=A0ABV7E305_9SPHN